MDRVFHVFRICSLYDMDLDIYRSIINTYLVRSDDILHTRNLLNAEKHLNRYTAKQIVNHLNVDVVPFPIAIPNVTTLWHCAEGLSIFVHTFQCKFSSFPFRCIVFGLKTFKYYKTK